MASKFLCRCGETIRTNLYEGHGLRLLVPEELTDIPDLVSNEQAQAHVSDLVNAALVVAECPNCKALAVIDQDHRITLYTPLP
ncbi:MAG TPA: hypothetical protein VF584_04140 [Longimicrobium sp.]|jgi:hypothetical protein